MKRSKLFLPSTPDPYTQTLEEQDTNMANIDVVNIDLFILINQGLDRLEKHLKGEDTPLNNPIRIIEGVRSSLNTVRHNYQTAYQDIDNVITERDDRDNQIL